MKEEEESIREGEEERRALSPRRFFFGKMKRRKKTSLSQTGEGKEEGKHRVLLRVGKRKEGKRRSRLRSSYTDRSLCRPPHGAHPGG